MNFAMMFAIALGIDYALFIVVRFRGALAAGLSPRDATVHTMATAGKAVLASGLTVIAALLAVMLVPVPTFRSVPLGIVLAVLSVLAATLTLLPAALSALGHRINGGRIRLRSAADHRSERFAAWGRRLWARPLPYGVAAVAILLLLAAPALGLRTGMPTIAVVPHDADSREGHALLERAFGVGAPSQLQVVVDERDLARATAVLERDPGIAAVTPAQRAGGRALLTAVPTAGEGSRELRSTIDAVRAELPASALVGGPAAENRDLERALVSRLPLVVGVIMGLGFLLLVVLLRAPLAAAAAVAPQPARDRGGVRRRAARVPGRSARAGCWDSSRRDSWTRGRRSSSSPSCSRWRWTTRSSCWRRSRRRTAAPETRARRSSRDSPGRAV